LIDRGFLISANVATRERERERTQIKNEMEDNIVVVEKHGKREAIREEKLVNDPIVMEMSSRDVSN